MPNYCCLLDKNLADKLTEVCGTFDCMRLDARRSLFDQFDASKEFMEKSNRLGFVIRRDRPSGTIIGVYVKPEFRNLERYLD